MIGLRPILTRISGSGKVPKVSIVIASHNAAHVIELCLSTLNNQNQIKDVEIIIADSSTDGTDSIISEQFPDVKLFHYSEPLTIPCLRGYAIAEASGEIIAIIDPFSVVDSQWCSELIKVHDERPELVIGGAVELYEPEQSSLVIWGNYINEYGGFILPLEAGVVNILPGSNISYKRQALTNTELYKKQGFWKAFVNKDLESENNPLWLAPSVKVYLNKPLSFNEFFLSRYDHGRCYAAMRIAGGSVTVRLFRAMTTPLLPMLFLWRIGKNYWPKRRYRRQFILTLPLMFMLNISWAWGELLGYLRGSGQCCKKLFY